MNSQLQRMMMVLFLVLTIIAVTVLFWLPIDNSTSRILVARENASGNLLDLMNPDQDNTEADSEPTEGESEELPVDQSGLMADSREYTNSDDQNDNYDKLSAVPNTAESTKNVDVNVGYDVMGNPRNHISNYTVSRNDWFSTITGKHWQDLFMWPDLYTMNIDNLRSANPDLIFPGEKVSIYESLVADGEFSEADRQTLVQAYLKVYKIYKQAGESKALAAAQLLASAVRYDKDFLEKYSLDPIDKQMAQKLIREQKFLD